MRCHQCGGWKRNPDYEAALALINNPEVHNNLDKPIVQTLLQMTEVHIQGSSRPTLGVYYSPYHFVLQNGKYFKDCVPDPILGPPKLCYANSQRLAVENPDLLYAEGYLYAYGLPIMHGWNVTKEGIVLDTTVRNLDCREYFGIILNTSFILESMIFHEAYQGLIDNWKDDFPLLKDKELQKRAFWPP